MRSVVLLAMLAVASFAGCTGAPPSADALPLDDTRPADQSGFAPQTGHLGATTDELDLAGDLSTDCPADERFCIHAVATNEGAADLYVHDICITSWSQSLKQRDASVQAAEPRAHCEAWGLRALAPGQQMEIDFTWDGSLWDEDAEEYRAAPEDSYTWSVHFVYYMDAEGGGRTELSLDFPVIVGET